MNQKNCIKCHALIDYDAGFCLFCGSPQPGGGEMKKKSDTADNALKKPGQKLRVPVAVQKNDESDETENKKKKGTLSRENAKQENDKKNQKEKQSENLEYVAYHDPLTGAKNRQAYEKDVEHISQENVCAISVDCNNLKNTNDTKGHKYGDILLVTVAESLLQIFGDHVYRMGGDEFLVLLDGEGKEVVEKKLQDFYGLLEYKRTRMEEELEVEAAVGVAFGDGMKSIKDVLDEADRLMYQNKKDMKNKIKPVEPIKNNPLPLPVQPQPDDENEEEKKDNAKTTIKEYDANYDGYYDDTEAIVEEEIKQFSKESLKKALLLIAVFIVFIVFYFFIFF